MDINCPKCGEPLDADELHDIEGMTYQQARDAFFDGVDNPLRPGEKLIGCSAVGFRHNDIPDARSAMISQAARDIMGDDIDGIASMMEDSHYFGGGY